MCRRGFVSRILTHSHAVWWHEARARERQAAAASQDEADENDATEEEMTRERTTRVGRPRGGMKVAARIGEGLRREIERGRRPRVVRVGDG